jgi:hypothetical protein
MEVEREMICFPMIAQRIKLIMHTTPNKSQYKRSGLILMLATKAVYKMVPPKKPKIRMLETL